MNGDELFYFFILPLEKIFISKNDFEYVLEVIDC